MRVRRHRVLILLPLLAFFLVAFNHTTRVASGQKSIWRRANDSVEFWIKSRHTQSLITQQILNYNRLGSLLQTRRTLPKSTSTATLKQVEDEIRALDAQCFSFMSTASGSDRFAAAHAIPKAGSSNTARGIVLVGGKLHYRFVLHFLGTLRSYWKSTLPVEVFYRGKEDLSEKQRESLVSFGNVVVRDILKVSEGLFNDTEASLGEAGYALKPFAQLASRFSEPMLVDADAVFFQDPEKLWDDEGYLDTGTLFYHDRTVKDNAYGTRSWLKDKLKETGLKPSKELKESTWWNVHEGRKHYQESGVVLINKSREDVLFSFMLSVWLNGKKPREAMRWIIMGEKETFWLGFELTKQPYSFVPSWGGAAGILDRAKNSMEVDNILHFDRDGKPLWLNGGLLMSKHLSGSGYLEIDTIGMDDGLWIIHRPCWTYSGATWKAAPEIAEMLKKMGKIAEEVDDKWKPTKFYWP